MRHFFHLIWILIIVTPGLPNWSEWSFDWTKRTDRDGKPAGIYDTTPFPIDEYSVTYDISSDEGIVTYNIGDKYYIDNTDNGFCSNCTTPIDSTYDPIIRDCGSGSEIVFQTIRHALNSVPSGNNTILIRGGIYTITSSNNSAAITKQGIDNTHRYNITGYGQERPVLDGSSMTGTTSLVTVNTSQEKSFVTIQRLKLQNCESRGFYARQSGYDAGINLIDIWAYNCAREAYEGGTYGADGNIHSIGVDSIWIYHCTSEHTYGKGYKISDDADDCIVEWSVAYECGFWSGIPNTPAVSAYGFDFAADPGQTNSNLILRYNISSTCLRGNEVREAPNFDIHHNEFTDPTHIDEFPGMTEGYVAQAALHIVFGPCYGRIYSNIFRDNTDTLRPYLLGFTYIDNPDTIYVFNNLLYGSVGKLVYLFLSAGNQSNIQFFNNSLYANTNTSLIGADDDDISSSCNVRFVNNILYQEGSGSCVNLDPDIDHSYNLYYFPNGTCGINNETGWQNPTSQNFWQAVPEGEYETQEVALSSTSPARDNGTNLSDFFTTDFHSTPRDELWDIGACEYTTTGNIIPLDVCRVPSANDLSVQINKTSYGMINFSIRLSKSGLFLLTIYDISGRLLWFYIESDVAKGYHNVKWNNTTDAQIGNGVYIVSIKNDNKLLTQKFTIINKYVIIKPFR